jgi:hypothetical protein
MITDEQLRSEMMDSLRKMLAEDEPPPGAFTAEQYAMQYDVDFYDRDPEKAIRHWAIRLARKWRESNKKAGGENAGTIRRAVFGGLSWYWVEKGEK